jgi:hypothetical protein
MSERSSVQSEYEKVIRIQIEERVRREGEHVARPHEDRARQFMPFAALSGLSAMSRREEEAFEVDETYSLDDLDL